MTDVTVERFAEPASLVRGLSRLRQAGLTPRGLLFLALAPDGAIHVGTPADPEQVTQIKVGEKLAPVLLSNSAMVSLIA